MSKHITIDIDATGNVTVEAHDFKGKGCAAATEAYEKCLGKVTATKKKPEFEQNAAVAKQQKVGG